MVPTGPNSWAHASRLDRGHVDQTQLAGNFIPYLQMNKSKNIPLAHCMAYSASRVSGKVFQQFFQEASCQPPEPAHVEGWKVVRHEDLRTPVAATRCTQQSATFGAARVPASHVSCGPTLPPLGPQSTPSTKRSTWQLPWGTCWLWAQTSTFWLVGECAKASVLTNLSCCGWSPTVLSWCHCDERWLTTLNAPDCCLVVFKKHNLIRTRSNKAYTLISFPITTNIVEISLGFGSIP